MSDNSVLFLCKICKNKYSSYKSLWNHNKKFHPTNNEVSDIVLNNVENNKLLCKYCNKKFKSQSNKCQHEKKFCKINKQSKKYDELEKIVKKLQEEIMNKNTITNNNNGTINNNNNNSNIVINNFGSESINKLTANDIKLLANENLNAFIKIVEMLNFDKKYPENHVFCNTSLDGNYLNVLNTETKQIEKILKKDFFDKVLLNSIQKINDILFRFEYRSDNEININKKYLIKLEDTSKKSEEIITNQKQKTTYKRNINQLSYNKKHLVLDTWSKLNLTENNNDYESESCELDTSNHSESDDTNTSDNS